MAQKTLIVALGSTGMQIALDVLGRIEDEYGSTGRVPWVEAVVFETAQKGTDDPLLKGRFVSLGMEPTAFTTALDSMKGGNGMDLGEWCDPEQLRLAQVQGTTAGAGNIRMIGRFSFLHPTNGAKILPLLTAKVNALNGLTAVQASAAVGELPWGGVANIEFGEAGGTGSVEVFVCGTLTGGTGSGSFLDMGYFLKAAGIGAGGGVGMFLVPHPQCATEVFKANAYAALTELNHYHTAGTKYTARFSALGRTVEDAGLPFKSVFLCAPAADTSSGIEDAVRSIGQFIYLQAVSGVGDAARAALINPGTVFAASRDTEGNPVSFNSMGVSVIEYPAAHIVKGCTARLLERSLALWSSGAGVQQGEAMGLLAQRDGLDPLRLAEHLMQAGAEGTASLDALLNQEVARAAGSARAGGIQQALESEAAIDVGFNSSAPATSHPIVPGHFLETIRKNGSSQIGTRRESVQSTLREALLDADRGLVWAKDYVKALGELAERETRALEGEADLLKQSQSQGKLATDTARGRVTESHRASGLLPPLYRGTAVAITVGEYEAALGGASRARLRTAVNAQLGELWREMGRMAAVYEHRLNDPATGLTAAASELQARLARRANDLDTMPPRANGTVLFTPGVTIPHDYKAQIAQAQAGPGQGFGAVIQGEAFAQRATMRAWSWLAADVVALKSTFDAAGGRGSTVKRILRDEEFAEPSRMARSFFEGLMATSVLDDPGLTADTDAVISGALTLSAASLSVDDNPRNTLTASGGGYTNPMFAFFRGSKATPSDDSDAPLAAKIVGILKGKGANVESLEEPYRIAFVTARAAFSLSMVAGLQPEGTPTFKIAHDNRVRSDGRGFHSRVFKKGSWRSLESSVPDPGLSLTRAKLLVALANGNASLNMNGLTLLDIPRPGDSLPLGNDLDEAAFELHRKGPGGQAVYSRERIALDTALKEREENPAAIARNLIEMTGTITGRGLHAGDQPLDRVLAERLIRPYVPTVSGLRENLNAIFPANPTKSDYLTFDGNGKPYYACKSCGKFLMSGNDGSPIPETCPQCGMPLTI